jgi:PAS domain S-box-containing protein
MGDLDSTCAAGTHSVKNLVIRGQSLEWLLASATDAIVIVDREGQIMLVNPALEQLFGYGPDELLGQTIEQLVPGRFRHGHTGQRDAYFTRPRPRAMGAGTALFGLHRDGREFPVDVSLSPLQSGQGVPLAMAVIHDVTSRKLAEAALQEGEARMRAVFETAIDAIITIDDRGRLERLNPAAERMFGYAEAEVAGKNVSMLMPSPHRDRHDGYLAHYLQTGERKIIGKGREVEGLRKDGSVFPMDLAVAEMTLGERRMFTGMVRDITGRKLAEQALLDSRAELRNLAAHQEAIKERERKHIAQEVHDELGGLLTGINAHISVAIERAGGEPDPLLVDAARLTREAMDAVRKVITDLRPSVLDQLGVWAALEWYAEQVARRSGLLCECHIAPEVQQLELGTERSTMLFRIVQEGLTNVVRHAQAKRVGVHVDCRGDLLLVRVEDDGKGVDEERLLNKESWGIRGMLERARHFGGKVTIKGSAGHGTTLSLELPLGPIDAESDD